MVQHHLMLPLKHVISMSKETFHSIVEVTVPSRLSITVTPRGSPYYIVIPQP